jgi:hypothetical protein
MGRSFDRGGRSRKERERGKRHAYRQAERDREAREAVMQAKRMAAQTALANRRTAQPATPAVTATVNAVATPPAAQTAPTQLKRPGFLAQVFGRIFRKSA